MSARARYAAGKLITQVTYCRRVFVTVFFCPCSVFCIYGCLFDKLSVYVRRLLTAQQCEAAAHLIARATTNTLARVYLETRSTGLIGVLC